MCECDKMKIKFKALIKLQFFSLKNDDMISYFWRIKQSGICKVARHYYFKKTMDFKRQRKKHV